MRIVEVSWRWNSYEDGKQLSARYDLQARQKELAKSSGTVYYDNRLVVAKPNGVPFRRETVSSDFGHLLKRFNMPHIRFHDLRHAAATNMHQLTGDFYTVGQKVITESDNDVFSYMTL